MKPERLSCLLLSFLLIAVLAGCNQPVETVVQPTAQSVIIETPAATPSLTSTPAPPTTTATSTGTSTSTLAPVPPTKTPTATSTNTATPTGTSTSTPLPTDTPTSVPIPTDTPTPEITSVIYPVIPDGQGLFYVINFHADEAQFHFFDRPEEYRIPGKSIVPDGGILELFLAPGQYRWAGVIQSAELRGEGEIEIVAGQIQGLGLAYGKIGPKDVVEGINLGSDPLSPPVTPSPTPIPVAPTPSPGKTTLVFITETYSGDILFQNQSHSIEQQNRLFLELDPIFYDINFAYTDWNRKRCTFSSSGSNVVANCVPGELESTNYQVTLVTDQICQLHLGDVFREGDFICSPK